MIKLYGHVLGAFLDAIGDMGFHYVASRHYANGNEAIVVDEPEVTRDHFYGQAYLLAMPLVWNLRRSNWNGLIYWLPYQSLSIGYPTKADMQASGIVISASPGGPAYRTGVSSRDVILAIDDTST
ncbi:hypothetical protein VNO78_20371 [Psophocarpus tetragonolobus]|uniref:PDZ domain-containing protein n=1 Tax=Psophocarpus tetragonolobus TaxID=3891 RepID=A0AAN9SEG0_PSOTE